VLIRTDQPDLATTLRAQAPQPHVDIVPSPAAGGVWLMEAHYQLETMLPSLTLLSADQLGDPRR
jgi:hypothetical protein